MLTFLLGFAWGFAIASLFWLNKCLYHEIKYSNKLHEHHDFLIDLIVNEKDLR